MGRGMWVDEDVMVKFEFGVYFWGSKSTFFAEILKTVKADGNNTDFLLQL